MATEIVAFFLLHPSLSLIIETFVSKREIEDVKAAKPSPEGVKFALEHLRSTPKETLYIGDSIVDAETARNARVDFAGVLNGMTTADELRAYPHRIIMKDLSDLL